MFDFVCFFGLFKLFHFGFGCLIDSSKLNDSNCLFVLFSLFDDLFFFSFGYLFAWLCLFV